MMDQSAHQGPEIFAEVRFGSVMLAMRYVEHPDVDPRVEFPIVFLRPAEAIELGLRLQRLGQDLQRINGSP